MKNKNKIDIAWLLKNCDVRTNLYCPMFGNCLLNEVSTDEECIYPIKIISPNDNLVIRFSSDGVLFYIERNGVYFYSSGDECLLFPSSNYRSWEGITIKNGKLITPDVKPQPTYGKYYCFGISSKSEDIRAAFEKYGARNVKLFDYKSCLTLYYIDNIGYIRSTAINDEAERELIAQGYKKLKLSYQPKDKELVWCYDSISNYSRSLRFYDAKNRCTFKADDGTRDGIYYDNYEPYEGEYPEWAKEALNKLED